MTPLFVFVFAGLFSPGPNVILLTLSGARFGFRRTLPHVAGVVVGVGIIAAITAFGIGALVIALPWLTGVMKIIAAAWILWMAWRLLHAALRPQASNDRPFTFWQAVLFQWINPKLWAVALTASSAYLTGFGPLDGAVTLGLTFSGLNLFVCLFWSCAGSLLQILLREGPAWRIFTTVMAALLAASALMVFL